MPIPACSPEVRRAFLRRWRGTPYDRVERHCWWLAALAQGELFGRILPAADPTLIADPRARAAALRDHPARRDWRAIPAPADGALVLMGKVAGAETHVGTWLAEDGGLILHTDEGHGVALDPPLELSAAKRWRLSYHLPAEVFR